MAIATRLASQGWHVFAGVSSDNDAAKLHNRHRQISPFHLDVTKQGEIRDADRMVGVRLGGETFSGLVNNAGIAEMGPLTVQPLDEIRAHFEVKVFGAIATCQAFPPLLGQDRSRHGAPVRIVNITSLGG